MKWYLQFALLSVLSGVFFSFAQNTFGQGVPQAGPPQSGVVMTKLFPPVYPPLARQARIAADVKVELSIRRDGSVASAVLFSGHPMLAPAAIESAKQSQFECNGCAGETKYVLTYTFGFIEDLKPYDKFEDRPVRAGKCFYLWKCGVVRVNTFDSCTSVVPPEITQSPGRVKILVFPACIEAIAASREALSTQPMLPDPWRSSSPG
jgi:hypothetical protein